MHSRTVLTSLLLALAFIALAASGAHAGPGGGKGGGGGGGGGGNGGGGGEPPTEPATGIVYYQSLGSLTLGLKRADVSSGAILQTEDGVGYYPSREQHAGKRWFASYWADPAWGSYPNGQPRQRLRLASSDAAGQLVDSIDVALPADVELNGQNRAKWLDDPATGTVDGLLTWPARRWDLSASSPTVVEAGVYTAAVTFDAGSGDITGVDGNSVTLAVAFPLSPTVNGGQDECYAVGGDWFADLWQLDWRSDGARVVYMRCSDHQLAVADVASGQHVSLGVAGTLPEWSPDLDPDTSGYQGRVAFQGESSSIGFLSILTIDADASDPSSTVSTVVSGKAKGKSPYRNEQPMWSPDGTHIAFERNNTSTTGIGITHDVRYVAASGEGETVLDDSGRKPAGWVSAPAP